MILVDAGPLIALGLPAEVHHDRCVKAAATLAPPFVTTWPALTEAMHILGRGRGRAGQQGLWRLIQSGRLDVAEMSTAATRRAAELMAKYADVPMDLADATLVALAEERDANRIFTLDSDFHVYRLGGTRSFDVVPA